MAKKKSKSLMQIFKDGAREYAKWSALEYASKQLHNACDTLLKYQEAVKNAPQAPKDELVPDIKCKNYTLPSFFFKDGSPLFAYHEKDPLRDISEVVKYTKRAFTANGISVEVVGKTYGPTCAKITIKPTSNIQQAFAPKMDRQIKYYLNCENVRIERAGSHIIVYFPFSDKSLVCLGDMIRDHGFEDSPLTTIPIGVSPEGERVYADIAKMPHMLVAGETGSGKSVMLQSIATSLLFRNTPDDLRLYIVDPKAGAEFQYYGYLAHCKTSTELPKTVKMLHDLCDEMETRYKVFAKYGCKDISDFRNKGGKMPRLVLIVDELADLMESDARKDIETCLVRIAQKSRAAGIHMILATQYPIVKVISGQIKANIPCRVALSVSTRINSQVIIDRTGAEQLTGNGDMLFLDGKDNRVAHRLQAPFVDTVSTNATIYELIRLNQGGKAA